MKKILTKAVNLSMFITIGLISCKKEDFKHFPTPVKSTDIQFVVNALPGEPTGGTTNLYAVVIIKKGSNGEEVISNKKLAFAYNGKYKTEKIKLDSGAYKLTKFLIVNGAGKVLFAVPFINSAKASQVQNPLAIAFNLPKTTVLELPVEVLKVEANETPESFGYPAGTFNEHQTTPVEMVKIKVKTIIKVGSITYDSIPATIKITTWDANNVAHVKDITLQPGVNEISLPKAHQKFHFKLNKWGLTDELNLTKDQLNENVVYTLGGSRSAKKIRQEDTYLFASGNYQLSAKTIYTYNSFGNINDIKFYGKLPQHQELQFLHKNVYNYLGNKVSKINIIEANGTTSGFTEFTYNAAGTKVINMNRKNYDVETGAAVDYSYVNGHSLVSIYYLYNNGKTMEYKMKFKGGNNIEDAAISANGSEGGTYNYDFNINPYAHMNMPNIYLSNLSINNLTSQYKTFSGGFPSADLYKLEYNYDADGFPIEVIKYYRSYLSGQDIYKTKTIITY